MERSKRICKECAQGFKIENFSLGNLGSKCKLIFSNLFCSNQLELQSVASASEVLEHEEQFV
ncbi:hypothetical protein T07_10278 [Trichinella nelsoni]|uniref:Uncharacterized protein n=1 Tax=Trichinella nelsoni TaxID=6336 RepID=A0A0V0S8M2_9BILA|nr:hypothetical protein T07_10278 [Trichinella nelsoni]